jgi:hypothetical protein
MMLLLAAVIAVNVTSFLLWFWLETFPGFS